MSNASQQQGPFKPVTPMKHRRHRRRVQQELRQLAEVMDEQGWEELELEPKRKERVGPYDLRMPPEREGERAEKL